MFGVVFFVSQYFGKIQKIKIWGEKREITIVVFVDRVLA
jgi:hypothetical protein